jgi:hypothetical protein
MFRRLFGNRDKRDSKPVTRISYEGIASMTLPEVIELLKKRGEFAETMTVNEAQDLSRRLVEISYFDESVTLEDRERSATLEHAVWKTIEEGLRDSPDALQVRREARDHHIEGGKQIGALSLAHKIRDIDPKDVAGVIVSSESAPLLVNFPRDLIDGQRGSIALELLRSRAVPLVKEDWAAKEAGAISALRNASAVIAAGTLILRRDATAMWLFTADERKTLGQFLDDYVGARACLVKIGAIPDVPAMQLSVSDILPASVHNMMLQSCADGARRAEASQTERYRAKLARFDEDTRGSIMAIVFGIRLLIWRKLLKSLAGPDYVDGVFAAVPDASWPAASLPMVARMDDLYQRALSDDDNTTAFHNWIVAGFVLDLLDGKPASVRTDETVQMCAELFESELFHFSHYVRFLVRFMARGDAPEVMQSMCEDSLGEVA